MKSTPTYTVRLHKILAIAVLANLLLSVFSPALAYPLSVQPVSPGAAKSFAYAAETVMFKLLGAEEAHAFTTAAASVAPSLNAIQTVSANAIPVADWGAYSFGQANLNQRAAIAGGQEAENQAHLTLMETVYGAAKLTLDNFLNTMAYDTATWLASGGKGQQPMFYTQGWGPYLRDAADAAAGDFISKLSGSWLNFNVCNPSNLGLKISLGLGLQNIQRPRPPQCTLTQMLNNWDSVINDPNFLDRFKVVFDPQQNDLGIAFQVSNYYFNSQDQAQQDSFLARFGNGFKDVVSKISGFIKTPKELVDESGRHIQTDAVTRQWVNVQYGSVVADAAVTFVQTLAGKLFQRLLVEGLVGDSTSPSSSNNSALLSSVLSGLRSATQTSQDLSKPDSSVQGLTGQANAQLRFVDLLVTGNNNTQPYDILSQLASCTDPKNPGPEDCAITPTFMSAINNRLTVQQAIDQGLIDGDAPFGAMSFDSSTLFQGIPYRSIVLLRVHRIVPVAWEIAAQAIDQFDHGKKISLRDLISKYNDSDTSDRYRGLIDPNWVLEVPTHLCKAEGYGPKIIFSQASGGNDANGNGSYNDPGDTQPSLQIGRAEYCADTQTCIEKNDDGSCQYYGYCSEERRVWDFGGSTCPAQFNTCQTFQSATGELNSYLRDSLNFNGCSIDNVGCQWYCTQFNTVSNVWTCQNNSEAVLKPCSQPNGCQLNASCEMPQGSTICSDRRVQVNLTLSVPCDSGSKWWNGTACVVSSGCTIPRGGVQCETSSCDALPNLLPNPSFEQGTSSPGLDYNQVANRWEASVNGLSYFQRVSGATERIANGRYDIRFYNAGSVLASPMELHSLPIALSSSKTYTFSGWFYNHLNTGAIKISVNGITKTIDVKNQWQQISFDFDGSGSTVVKIAVFNNGDQVSGTAWFDDFRISENCIANPITLTLIGSTGLDQSKLHLDANAATCAAGNDGCSEFISTLPNQGTNLVANGSFEDWANQTELPPGWTKGADWEEGGNKVEAVSPGAVGNMALKLTNGPTAGAYRDLRTQPVVGMKPNTSYRVSFWVKSDIVDSGHWYAEVLGQHTPSFYCSSQPQINCQNGSLPDDTKCNTSNGETCILPYQQLTYGNQLGLNLTTEWQRYVMDVVTTHPADSSFALSFDNSSTDRDHSLYIDGVQIEEVATDNPITSDYSDYGSVNQVFLKKAPAMLGCQGYTADRPSPSTIPGVIQTACTGDGRVWFDAACHVVDPGACNNYAPYCFADEVGCDMYKPAGGGTGIPGVVNQSDYCPTECVGYEAYKQSRTNFENVESLAYFIPKTAVQCTAADAGCDAFTNLDEISQGGEAIHDYSYLRLCRKPDDAAANCQNFYSWQGSDESGYQLHSYVLSSANSDPNSDPATAIVPVDTTGCTQVNGFCADRWQNLPDAWCSDKSPDANGLPNCCDSAEDTIANPFCRQFYSLDGTPHYALYNNTITCADDCHPYRKTSLGEDPTSAEANCTGSSGTWDTTNNACIYHAIPTESVQCPAQAAGCREYRGNSSGNVFTAYSQDFESGQTSDFLVGGPSSEALNVGGHSIKSAISGGAAPKRAIVFDWADLGQECNDQLPACSNSLKYGCYDQSLAGCWANDHTDGSGQTCTVSIGQQYCGTTNNIFIQGQTYVISFWAKSGVSDNANASVQITVEVADQNSTPKLSIGITGLTPEWNYYTFGPFTYSGPGTGAAAHLQFVNSSTGTANEIDFNVDNIQIKQVQSFVYVVKNSWKTPVSCDTNPYVSPALAAPQFMLGCEQYRDSANRINNLKSFSSLCRAEAVGCQAMIDTQNSASPFANNANAADPISDVKTPADTIAYIVDQPQYQCQSQFKGCQALGLPAVDQNDAVVGYQTVYKINDPDKYDSILCLNEEVGCQEYQSDTGLAFFKDPGSRTCQYRLIPGKNSYGWFKTGSASAAPDCPIIQPPVGPVHPDPSRGYAGLCPGEYNSCSELIDPTSNVGKSILFNGNFNIDFNGNGIPDGWDDGTGAQTNHLIQAVHLKRNTLYTLSVTTKDLVDQTLPPTLATHDNRFTFAITNCTDLTSYDHSLVKESNNWIIPRPAYSNDTTRTTLPNQRMYSGRFEVSAEQTCSLDIRDSAVGATVADITSLIAEVGIRETGNYFVLDNSIDKTGCNGLVAPEVGCVLFNDRSGVNYKIGEDDISNLTFDADVSSSAVNGGVAVTQCAGNCDSNSVVKVQPDRTCESWLYCKTQGMFRDDSGVDRPYCADIGLCDSLDDNGNCNNQVASNTNPNATPRDYFADARQIANFSGYNNPGFQLPTGEKIQGYYQYADMYEQGQTMRVPNGNFELSFSNTTEPVGWSTVNEGHNTEPIEWREDKFKIDRDINNLIEGSGYLRLNAFWEAQSEEIDATANATTSISAMINTQFLLQPNTFSNPSNITLPQAQVLVKALDKDGHPLVIKNGYDPGNSGTAYPSQADTRMYCSTDYTIDCSGLHDGDACGTNGVCVDPGWQLLQDPSDSTHSMAVSAGLDWQSRYFIFKTPPGTAKLRIKLSNQVMNGETNCSGIDRYNRAAANCTLGGYSFFDAISVKPVLKVNNNAPNDFVARSCRLYPTSASLSCVNLNSSGVSFGEYGYCVTADPQNPSQCLQWWPVDQIQGETLDEIVAGYNDRVPLDYCTQQQDVTIRVGANATLTTLDLGNSNLSGNWTSMVNSNGQQMKFSQFNVNDDYRALFRYPYVQYLEVHGSISGGSLLSGAGLVPTVFIPIPYGARLYRDHTCWKFISILDNPGFSDIANGALSGTNDLITGGLFSNPLLSGILGGTTFWRPGDPGHESDTYGSYCWSTSPGEDWAGFAAIGLAISVPLGDFGIGAVVSVGFPYKMAQAITILTSFNTELSKLVGTMVGLAGPVAAKIITDQDESTGNTTIDPVPDLEGDILGISAQMLGQTNGATAVIAPVRVNGDVPVKYCTELVRVVTAAGSNKGYANRLTSGSGYLLPDLVWNGLEGAYQQRKYQYYNPFDFRQLLAAHACQGGDRIYMSCTADADCTGAGGGAGSCIIDPFSYYSSDYQPFGGLVPPANSQYPTAWDSKSASAYRQPLLFEPPMLTTFQPPYQARMGEIHTPKSIEQIFGKSFDIWHWQWAANELGLATFDANQGGQYKLGPAGVCLDSSGAPIGSHSVSCDSVQDCIASDSGYTGGSCSFTYQGVTQPWDVVTDAVQCGSCSNDPGVFCTSATEGTVCGGGNHCNINVRPNAGISGNFDPNSVSLCVVKPTIGNIKVNGYDTATIQNAGLVKLEFTIDVDPDQLPITGYWVDWGDGNISIINGVVLRNRNNPENPFVLNHLYDFWQLQKTAGISAPSRPHLDCVSGDGTSQLACSNDTCTTEIHIRAMDNWRADSGCVTVGKTDQIKVMRF